MNRGYNNLDNELLKLVKKVNKMGINVVNAGDPVHSMCLTIVLDQQDDSVKEMVPVVDDRPSPFTWRLGTYEFKKWARIATKYPYSKLNTLISSIVRRMEPEAFDELRKHKHLESEFLEMLYTEMQSVGLKGKLSAGIIVRLFLIYGGLIEQEYYIEKVIIKLFTMILNGRFAIDKCRSCRYCRLHVGHGVGRKCVSPTNAGFVIPSDMEIGKVLQDFPEIYIKEVGDKNIALTMWIPENKKTCDHYRRRF